MPELAYDITDKRIAIIGCRGMVGSALMRRLGRENCRLYGLAREDCDLTRQADVEQWFEQNRPQLVFLAAAKVGGIAANSAAPAEFLYDNLMIEANVIEAARISGVEKLVFLGSSCIYPKFAGQPIIEDALLTGPLEPTNQWYAIAKIAGIKLCQAYRRQYGSDFISAQPTNLYGPGDNYDLETSHVVPALLRKTHEAKLTGRPSMTLWGTGSPKREFLHVDDLADALVFIARHYSAEQPINIGSGEELSIAALADLIAEIVGFSGQVEFDSGKPDGTPRKLLDSSRLSSLGWAPSIPLEAGLRSTYADFASSAEQTHRQQHAAA
jgi:GDP-L-fucose synthase